MTQANRKIMILRDTDAARAFVTQWRLDNPQAQNVSIKLDKHCEGKQVTVDYDDA